MLCVVFFVHSCYYFVLALIIEVRASLFMVHMLRVAHGFPFEVFFQSPNAVHWIVQVCIVVCMCGYHAIDQRKFLIGKNSVLLVLYLEGQNLKCKKGASREISCTNNTDSFLLSSILHISYA